MTERRALEPHLQALTDSIDAVFYVTDLSANRLDYLSPGFERIWGRERTALGRDLAAFPDTLHPDDRPEFLRNKARQACGEPVSTEYRILLPDGATRWIRDRSYPVPGRPSHAAGFAIDITDRHEAEQALRTSEERLNSLMSGIPQLVWRADKPSEWSWSSPQWQAYTGQTERESRGCGWLQPVHPEDRESALEAWSRAEAEGGFEADYRIRNRQGDYRWFTTRGTPVHDEDGRIIEWLGTSTDVHDLRSAQARQAALLAELQTRVRNTLGFMRSIVRRSVETSRDAEELADHLEDRIDAFSRVQAALVKDAANAADLQSLVEDELLSNIVREGERLSVHGPRLLLNARAAELIGLGLHELATNALTHGALRGKSGRILVSWSTEGERLRLEWRETGLDLDRRTPRHDGFGAQFLLESLPDQLGATTALEVEEPGIRFMLQAPLEAVAAGVDG